MDDDIASAIHSADEDIPSSQLLSDGTPFVKITTADLAKKLDAIGLQMDWLVENLASLFGFVQQMSGNGGGIRGLMKAMKAGAPELKELEDRLNAG